MPVILGPAPPLRALARCPGFSTAALDRAVRARQTPPASARAATSARGRRRRMRHVAPAKGHVRDGREARLVPRAARARARRSSRRTAGRGGVGEAGTRTQKQYVRRPPGATSRRARLPHDPQPERGRARATRPVWAGRSRGPRGRRGRRPGPAATRSAGWDCGACPPPSHDLGPAVGVELGDDPGLGEGGSSATGSASHGRIAEEQRRGGAGTGRRGRASSPATAGRVRGGRASSTLGAAGDAAAQEGGGLAPASLPHGLSPGDRAAQDDEAGVEAEARGPAWPAPPPR